MATTPPDDDNDDASAPNRQLSANKCFATQHLAETTRPRRKSCAAACAAAAASHCIPRVQGGQAWRTVVEQAFSSSSLTAIARCENALEREQLFPAINVLPKPHPSFVTVDVVKAWAGTKRRPAEPVCPVLPTPVDGTRASKSDEGKDDLTPPTRTDFAAAAAPLDLAENLRQWLLAAIVPAKHDASEDANYVDIAILYKCYCYQSEVRLGRPIEQHLSFGTFIDAIRKQTAQSHGTAMCMGELEHIIFGALYVIVGARVNNARVASDYAEINKMAVVWQGLPALAKMQMQYETLVESLANGSLLVRVESQLGTTLCELMQLQFSCDAAAVASLTKRLREHFTLLVNAVRLGSVDEFHSDLAEMYDDSEVGVLAPFERNRAFARFFYQLCAVVLDRVARMLEAINDTYFASVNIIVARPIVQAYEEVLLNKGQPSANSFRCDILSLIRTFHLESCRSASYCLSALYYRQFVDGSMYASRRLMQSLATIVWTRAAPYVFSVHPGCKAAFLRVLTMIADGVQRSASTANWQASIRHHFQALVHYCATSGSGDASDNRINAVVRAFSLVTPLIAMCTRALNDDTGCGDGGVGHNIYLYVLAMHLREILTDVAIASLHNNAGLETVTTALQAAEIFYNRLGNPAAAPASRSTHRLAQATPPRKRRGRPPGPTKTTSTISSSGTLKTAPPRRRTRSRCDESQSPPNCLDSDNDLPESTKKSRTCAEE